MTVLLVDDSKTMRMLIQRAIRQAGFNGLDFIEAENGIDALNKLNQDDADLILSDWNMPEMTGIDFLRSLREAQIETTFGFITSETSKSIHEEAMKEGAKFIICKPFTPDDIQLQLGPLLGRHTS